MTTKVKTPGPDEGEGSKEEKALALWQEKYPAMTTDVGALLKESMGENARLGIQDLPTVKVPAGGAINWQLPDGSAAPILQGVLIVYQPTRAYWSAEFGSTGGKTPPDCSSDDALHGNGTFGHLSEIKTVDFIPSRRDFLE